MTETETKLLLTITKQESKLNNLTLKEKVDIQYLNRLLKYDGLKNDEKHNDIAQLKGYKKKITKKGLVNVKYQRKPKFGRVYANKGLSYQNFRKPLRHTLCSEYYMDLDIVNAHPDMLSQICEANGLSSKFLDKYISTREHYLAEIVNITSVDRSEAKMLFIRMMYGGSIEQWSKDNNFKGKLPKYYNKLQKEINNISIHIFNANAQMIKGIPKEKRDNKDSVLSYFLQEYENRVLEVVYDYLNDNGYIENKIATLCFDGIMCKKTDKDITELCDELTDIVEEKIGFDLKFEEKKFNKVITEIIEVTESDDEDEDDCSNLKMYNHILKHSKARNLKKNNTYIMKPCSNSPIVYENFMEFQDFVNMIFKKGSKYYKLFREKPSNMGNMMSYLENYDDEDLPFIKLNKYVFSFNNGYLDITDLKSIQFNKYNDTFDNDIITSIHYDFDFDIKLLNKSANDIKTPLFDKICNYHFEDQEILETFYGMCGRLHYPTNQYDRFNCMLFIKGGANTGKSTTGNIIMRNHQNIGTISGKMEKTFGLQSLIKKNIVYNADMNKNFPTLLDKGDFQRIIEGSCLDIPVKNKASINNFKWEIPLFFLANYFPEYKDSSGAIPRRICAFFMDKFLTTRDTTIEQRCINTEGHLILLKTLKSYQDLITKYSTKTFEDWGIEYFKRGYEEMTNKCNNLYNFLTLAPNDFEVWTSHEEGSVISDKKLKEVVERYYYKNNIKDNFDLDRTTLGRFDYQIKRVNICAACGKKPNRGECCNNYNKKNRRKRTFIHNIKIHYKNEYISDKYEIED